MSEAYQQTRRDRKLRIGRLSFRWGGGMAVWGVNFYGRGTRARALYLRTPWRTLSIDLELHRRIQ